MSTHLLSYWRILLLGCALAVPIGSAGAVEVRVSDAAGFREAVAKAEAGVQILLEAGDYGGGFHFSNLRGRVGEPIVIAAADPAKPPVFRGGNTGLHLSAPAFVELRDLIFTQHAINGLNVDDSGGTDAANGTAHHVVMRNLRITDIGGDGNHDGIKLSGLYDFQVTGCTIERWGTRGGSAIDMVGCHRGVIAGNVIRHVAPAPPNCTAVQCKGGTSDIAIRENRFENAGGRGVNIGGSTGLAYFRPKLSADGGNAEARAIRVEGNHFVGGVTAVAFVGADGGIVRFNTIEHPGRWALRILQENRAPGFVACRNGSFTDNVVIFDSTRWAEGGVNLGAGTAPETFTFARNWWYCADRPERSEPRLPAPEIAGVYGRDPAAALGVAGASAWREGRPAREP